jgi:hypothetical protein
VHKHSLYTITYAIKFMCFLSYSLIIILVHCVLIKNTICDKNNLE